jgi:hypothetical protein
MELNRDLGNASHPQFCGLEQSGNDVKPPLQKITCGMSSFAPKMIDEEFNLPKLAHHAWTHYSFNQTGGSGSNSIFKLDYPMEPAVLS